ncbi:MAG: DUF4277 domain-containing protein [Desulfobulbaceae bacterium]|nr:DUF4277 domain-containing protein [Desulfobulbaceae bacterium]
MVAFEDLLDQMQITRPDHLPVIAAFCRRISLIDVIDRIVPNEMEVSVGTLVQGMVLDTLLNIRTLNCFWAKRSILHPLTIRQWLVQWMRSSILALKRFSAKSRLVHHVCFP